MKEEYVVEIINQDSFGNGIAKIDNKVIFVKNGIVGENLKIKIIENKKNYSNALIKEIIKRSNNRRDYKCPYYNECGGCSIGHINYENQLLFKKEKIISSLSRIANINDIKINDTMPSPEEYYRNKVILRVDRDIIGFYDEKTHDIINIKKCIISNHKINKIIEILSMFISKYKDNNINEVFIRSIDETMICIAATTFIYTKELLSYLEEIVESIYINNILVKGKNYIVGSILGTKFNVSKDSFFQVNKYQTEQLYKKIIEYSQISKNDTVLDLYCGVGTISLVISKYTKKVIGIEIIKDAIINAKENALLNKIENTEFICGKVENIIENIKDKIDVIILDPPRNGSDTLTLQTINKINPKTIIYVSCNPDTLARDLKELMNNYKIVEITPYDMFPNTYHVECVCKLIKI